ncbi:MAG: hypothetical protein ABS79_07270 [Planctomycetes bacterium SCN 63-9]|nr:MAG: hypothetical protein ABS79_07270 [Planctomycetes bacterium SCN 63-9]
MIWVRGELVADDALKISVIDRVFEHGIGLFETFRTWNRHATLLPRHLERLRRSAHELGLPLDPTSLPDEAAVAALLDADGRDGDAMLRITMSGGMAEKGSCIVWMRSFALPPATSPEGWKVDTGFWDVSMTNPLARHKSLNYWERRVASELAHVRGSDESLSQSPEGTPMEGTLWEGSRTNLFVGIGDRLLTPAVGDQEPILPGIMRGLVLERADLLSIRAIQVPVTGDILGRVTEAFLTNSVRGIIPVRRIGPEPLPECPGPLATRLWDDILPWLESGGEASEEPTS